MSIQYPPNNPMVVDLPFSELKIAAELKAVNEAVGDNSNCDVIIDFSRVEVLTSSSLSNLLILHNLLTERGDRLILCNVSVITKFVFTVAGIDEVFDFANDKSDAVAAVQAPH